MSGKWGAIADGARVADNAGPSGRVDILHIFSAPSKEGYKGNHPGLELYAILANASGERYGPLMAQREVITPDEHQELKRLYRELERLSALAADELRTDGQPLMGEQLARFLNEDAKVAAISRKIREIVGED